MRALVISGGGAKGAFAVGALKFLMNERGLEFDMLAGTSTGALIAPMIAARGKAALAALEEEYTTVKTGDILNGVPWMRVLAGKPSLRDSDPLRKRIEKRITDDVYRALTTSSKRMAVTTVDLRDGKLVYYQTGTPPIPIDDTVVQVTSREQLVNAIHSSASIPFSMPPVVNSRPGHPEDGYVDGGVREYVPIEIAIDSGADEICCIILAPTFDKRPLYEKRFGNVLDVAQRSVDLLSEEVGASDLKLSQLYTAACKYLGAVQAKLIADGVSPATVNAAFAQSAAPNPFEGKRAVRLCVIRPERPLLGDTLKFDPEEMRANLEYGYQCASEQWDRCK
jgi:predicted acylesterase/phospholipase RssA